MTSGAPGRSSLVDPVFVTKLACRTAGEFRDTLVVRRRDGPDLGDAAARRACCELRDELVFPKTDLRRPLRGRHGHDQGAPSLRHPGVRGGIPADHRRAARLPLRYRTTLGDAATTPR